jgi:hypothetical protein
MKWAGADDDPGVRLKRHRHIPGALSSSSCRMLPFLVRFVFYGLGLWMVTLPPAVAVAESLRGRWPASLAISDEDSSAGLVRGESQRWTNHRLIFVENVQEVLNHAAYDT